MKQTLAFAGRCGKELLRDPLNLFFCLAFPLVLLVMFTLFNIPADVYRVENFAPGIISFAYSFVSMFGGMLMAADRESSFFARLSAAPIRSRDLIGGYALPLLPLTLAQSALFLLAAVAAGLEPGWHLLIALPVMLPAALFYIGFGLLLGAVMKQKQIGALFSLFVTVSTWLSGMWFDLGLLGRWMEISGKCLPFWYAVDAGRSVLSNNYVNLLTDIPVLLGWTLLMFVLAAVCFQKRLKGKGR